jgi:hypothetical protein
LARGDVAVIVDTLTDDTRWVSHFDSVVPWSGDFSGKDRIPQFFEAILQSADVEAFEPKEWIAEGDASCRSESLNAESAPLNSPARDGSSSGGFVMRRSIRTSSFMILHWRRPSIFATELFPSQFVAGRMDFDGNFDRMKALGFRKETKRFSCLVAGKRADARAIITDPKNSGPIKVEDTISALQYGHANKLAFTQKS